MSAVRLYFDADSMERALVVALRARGVDVATAFEAGMGNAADEEQLELAAWQARVLVSYNASDFCRIHTELLAQGKSHAGIILIPQQRYSIGERMRRLLKVIAPGRPKKCRAVWSFSATGFDRHTRTKRRSGPH